MHLMHFYLSSLPEISVALATLPPCGCNMNFKWCLPIIQSVVYTLPLAAVLNLIENSHYVTTSLCVSIRLMNQWPSFQTCKKSLQKCPGMHEDL